jgi:FkbH-like protein
VEVEVLNENSLERAAQLFNKTNQMNLSTRRLTATELLVWSQSEGHCSWTFRVTDKFGEYGLCGVCSFMEEESQGWLVDFLLSCRVMGRGVEETMLGVVAEHAQKLGYHELNAEFVPTSKNQPCQQWFQNQPRVRWENGESRLSIPTDFAMPAYVHLTELELL